MWNEMKKRLVVGAVIVVLWGICMWMLGCGKLLEGTGNILEAGGQGLSFVGEHLVETGTKGE